MWSRVKETHDILRRGSKGKRLPYCGQRSWNKFRKWREELSEVIPVTIHMSFLFSFFGVGVVMKRTSVGPPVVSSTTGPRWLFSKVTQDIKLLCSIKDHCQKWFYQFFFCIVNFYYINNGSNKRIHLPESRSSTTCLFYDDLNLELENGSFMVKEKLKSICY